MLFAPGRVVAATASVLGPTRAPTFLDDILVVEKGGQMNGRTNQPHSLILIFENGPHAAPASSSRMPAARVCSC
jgi:hypothetical protein